MRGILRSVDRYTCWCASVRDNTETAEDYLATAIERAAGQYEMQPDYDTLFGTLQEAFEAFRSSSWDGVLREGQAIRAMATSLRQRVS